MASIQRLTGVAQVKRHHRKFVLRKRSLGTQIYSRLTSRSLGGVSLLQVPGTTWYIAFGAPVMPLCLLAYPAACPSRSTCSMNVRYLALKCARSTSAQDRPAISKAHVTRINSVAILAYVQSPALALQLPGQWPAGGASGAHPSREDCKLQCNATCCTVDIRQQQQSCSRCNEATFVTRV